MHGLLWLNIGADEFAAANLYWPAEVFREHREQPGRAEDNVIDLAIGITGSDIVPDGESDSERANRASSCLFGKSISECAPYLSWCTSDENGIVRIIETSPAANPLPHAVKKPFPSPSPRVPVCSRPGTRVFTSVCGGGGGERRTSGAR